MENETIQAMRELMAEQEQRIGKLLFDLKSELKEDIAELKEDIKEVKGSVGTIVDWIDEAEHAVEIRFPVRKKNY